MPLHAPVTPSSAALAAPERSPEACAKALNCDLIEPSTPKSTPERSAPTLKSLQQSVPTPGRPPPPSGLFTPCGQPKRAKERIRVEPKYPKADRRVMVARTYRTLRPLNNTY